VAIRVGDTVTDLCIEDFISRVRQKSKGKTRAGVCVAQQGDSLAHVVKVLLATGFHHLWVIDPAQEGSQLVGVCSFTDIFRQLCLPVS